MIEKIAFKIEDLGFVDSPIRTIRQEEGVLGILVTNFLNIAFIIAGFLMFFWLVWGIFQYIYSGGNKEGLQAARQRIMWAIIGFIIVVFAFLISQYTKEIFPQVNEFTNVTPITIPPSASP